MIAPDAKPPASQSGVQHLVGVTERSLGWPEDLRRIVESVHPLQITLFGLPPFEADGAAAPLGDGSVLLTPSK